MEGICSIVETDLLCLLGSPNGHVLLPNEHAETYVLHRYSSGKHKHWKLMSIPDSMI